MSTSLPIIALVGEPNVGKSTILNKIAGRKHAVTSDIAGTTRDRQYVDTSWAGAFFTLVDTAGVTFGGNDELEHNVQTQIEMAIGQADLLMLVVDGKQPVRSIDQKALLKFRKTKQPVVLVVNKVDSPKMMETAAADFAKLGVKPIFTISATTGRGIGDLLDYLADFVKEKYPEQIHNDPEVGIAVSIIGKPNVGKSSLFNTIIKEERVVVSPIPGTTRTAIDTGIEYKEQKYTFIDTAGLKKKIHRQELPDIYSGFQTFKAIRRSDICILMIDSMEDIHKQDQQIAQEILKLGKGLVIAANKIDEYHAREQGDLEESDKKLRDYLSYHFQFLWMSPVFLVSAKTGEGVGELLDAIKPIFDTRHRVAAQESLDAMLAKKLKQNPPQLLRDQKQPKVFGLKQLDTNPPMFELYVNYPAAISKQFRDSVKNGIIKDLGFWGTVITLKIRGKDKS